MTVTSSDRQCVGISLEDVRYPGAVLTGRARTHNGVVDGIAFPIVVVARLWVSRSDIELSWFEYTYKSRACASRSDIN